MALRPVSFSGFMKSMLALLLVGNLLAACEMGSRRNDEVTITLNNSGRSGDDGLPPFGPDVKGGHQTSAGETDATNAGDADGEIETDPFAIQAEILNMNAGKVKIAMLLPFTSNNDHLNSTARMLKDAGLLALFDQRNPTIQLVPYDTLGTVQGATQAAEQAVEDGAKIILGPLMSSNVDAASVVARQAGIPMLAFNNRLDAAGKGVYILGNSPRFEVEAILDYAQKQGVGRFVTLVPSGVYGDIIADTVRAHATIRGMTLVSMRYYQADGTDFTDLTREISHYDARHNALRARIKELEGRNDEAAKRALRQLEQRDTLGDVPYEAILLPALNQFTLRTMVAQLSQYEVDQPTVRFMGLSSWDELGNLSNEPPLVGAWYASLPDQGWNRFAKHFKNKMGYVPINLASISYEAVALASLLAGTKFQPDFSAERLEYEKGYSGIRGLFRLSPLGYAERAMAIKQVGKSQSEILEEAPASFDLMVN